MTINRKIGLKKISKLILWLVVICLFSFSSYSALSSFRSRRCKSIVPNIDYKNGNKFITNEEVIAKVQRLNSEWMATRICDFNTNEIESELNKNQYIDKADVYFDKRGDMNINIFQKDPIVRVFNQNGGYYIDANWSKFSTSIIYSKRLITVLGSIDDIANPKSSIDSFKQFQLKKVINYTLENKEWQDIIDHIYISNNGKISLKLVLLKPMMQIGYIDEDIELRMNKIKYFLDNTIKRINLNKYSEINFEFKNQIIARK